MGTVANGFTAQSEYDLGNGGIVDVHLEKGAIRIAVEIAVASRPSREIAHIKNCLAAGYEKVFDVFADERMLQKTQEALLGEVTAEERAKVQLLHLSKLSDLVYSMASLAGIRLCCQQNWNRGNKTVKVAGSPLSQRPYIFWLSYYKSRSLPSNE